MKKLFYCFTTLFLLLTVVTACGEESSDRKRDRRESVRNEREYTSKDKDRTSKGESDKDGKAEDNKKDSGKKKDDKRTDYPDVKVTSENGETQTVAFSPDLEAFMKRRARGQ